MTQLVYHPAFDPYNSLLRSCRLLFALPVAVDVTALRILDFFLLFPEELGRMRLSTKLRSAVSKLKAEPRFPYDRLPAPRTLYDRMGSSFDAGIQTMEVQHMIEVEASTSKIELRPDAIPDAILELVKRQNEVEHTLVNLLGSIADEFPSSGPNGLKDRSRLAEYRYDVF
jgi:hypothetical protein